MSLCHSELDSESINAYLMYFICTFLFLYLRGKEKEKYEKKKKSRCVPTSSLRSAG